jgi:hypothetical protein
MLKFGSTVSYMAVTYYYYFVTLLFQLFTLRAFFWYFFLKLLEHEVISSTAEALEDSLRYFRLVKTSNLFAFCGINCMRLLWIIQDLLVKFDVTLLQLSFETRDCLSLEKLFYFIDLDWE